jgi:surfactin synthase thioesterase subunit
MNAPHRSMGTLRPSADAARLGAADRLFGRDRPRQGVITYCLPDAGSGAGAFAGWSAAFGPALDVRPLYLPGRDRRIAEDPRPRPMEIADALAGRAGPPYVLYGHSMGARLAFAVIGELRRRPGAPLPAALCVGAAMPPDVRPPLVDAAELPDDDLVHELIARAGAGPELRDLPELRELVLPVVRADLRWIGSYPFRPGPGLPMPVIAFAGTDDLTDGAAQMLGWARRAGAGFRLYTVPGGHAFHRAVPLELVTRLTAEVVAAASAVVPDLPAPAGDEVHLFLTRSPDFAAGSSDDAAEPVRAAVLRRYPGGGAELRVSESRAGSQTLLAVTRDGAAGVHPDLADPPADPLWMVERAVAAAAGRPVLFELLTGEDDTT